MAKTWSFSSKFIKINDTKEMIMNEVEQPNNEEDPYEDVVKIMKGTIQSMFGVPLFPEFDEFMKR